MEGLDGKPEAYRHVLRRSRDSTLANEGPTTTVELMNL